jgi:hypothetical protein
VMAVEADDRVRDGRTPVRGQAALALAAVLEAMRCADNDHARLFALRDGAEAIGNSDGQALEGLRTEAIRVHHIKPDVVQAVLVQGAELASASRGRRAYAPPQSLGPTAATTIEAMLYALRRGLSCLDDPANRVRLRSCDEPAMKEIVSRLRSWKDRKVDWLPAWSDADIAKLITVRRNLREAGRDG